MKVCFVIQITYVRYAGGVCARSCSARLEYPNSQWDIVNPVLLSWASNDNVFVYMAEHFHTTTVSVPLASVW